MALNYCPAVHHKQLVQKMTSNHLRHGNIEKTESEFRNRSLGLLESESRSLKMWKTRILWKIRSLTSEKNMENTESAVKYGKHGVDVKKYGKHGVRRIGSMKYGKQ